MKLLTVDFETYYDKAFSLSKLTTEEYIRDDRFEVIGVAVQVDDDPPEWFSGTQKETAAWLNQFDWVNSFVLAHNTQFDGAILSWIFGIKAKRWEWTPHAAGCACCGSCCLRRWCWQRASV